MICRYTYCNQCNLFTHEYPRGAWFDIARDVHVTIRVTVSHDEASAGTEKEV